MVVEAPGGGSSLRQGAGKRSSGAPDLGSAAAEQRRDREKGFPFGVSPRWRINRRRGGGQPEVGQGLQAPPWCGQGWGRAGWPPGHPWLPSGPTRPLCEASFMLIFYLNFPKFLEHFLYG